LASKISIIFKDVKKEHFKTNLIDRVIRVRSCYLREMKQQILGIFFNETQVKLTVATNEK